MAKKKTKKLILKDFKQFMYFVLTKISNIRISFRQNSLTKMDYLQSVKIIKRGDVVLVGDFKTLSGLFMGQIFTHSLLYIGNGKCIHAHAKGVQKIHYKKIFDKYDNLLILRSDIHSNSDVIDKLIFFAKKQIGKAYDFSFQYSKNKFFCTNLISQSFKHISYNLGLKNKEDLRRDYFWLFLRIWKVPRADDLLDSALFPVYFSQSLKGLNSPCYKSSFYLRIKHFFSRSIFE